MIRIRPMRAADAAVVADLTTQLGYPVDEAELARRFEAVSARGDDAVLVARTARSAGSTSVSSPACR